MKTRITPLLFCWLLISSMNVQAQEPSEDTKASSQKPQQNEKAATYPARDTDAPKSKSGEKPDRYSGKGPYRNAEKKDFHDLISDPKSASYYKPYYPKSYPTPSGYINPNYHYPSRDDIDHGEKIDEAMHKHIVIGGKTMEEVLTKYYPESSDVFWEMDRIADPETGKLKPLSLDQRGVMGRNTWVAWCGGNEWFWDWLATEGVGLLDFVHLLDSRRRSERFAVMGLWNQPGMATNLEPGPWGLYLDKVTEPLTGRNGAPLAKRGTYQSLGDGKHAIESDGLDPEVYGYPSGVIGLRIFPNPNFKGKAAETWDADTFYSDRSYRSDPKLERPIRVGMSCAICHVAAHPLDPPADPAEPEWKNLSGMISNLNFRPGAVFGGQTHSTNFLNQFITSQQPGTVDTSMTSTDWVSNFNAVNPVFEFQARIHRATRNSPEAQPKRAESLPLLFDEGVNPRKFPRVLMDGADSVGAWAGLARVYLNIGLFGEQWNNVQNTVLGFTPRRPFDLETLHNNSVNWNVNEAYRIHYSALFFKHRLVEDMNSGEVRQSEPEEIYDDNLKFLESSTQAMHLENALVDGKRFADGGKVAGKSYSAITAGSDAGQKIFVKHCMVCHSSRQPDGYDLAFMADPPGKDGNEIKDGDWSKTEPDEPWPLTLPMSFRDWESFKESPAYKRYVDEAEALSGDDDDFFHRDNYLSNDIRIPVSLVATNAARPLAENALEGEVWHDFSSDDYKRLDPVGEIEYFDTTTQTYKKFQPEGNGRGFHRTPTLASVWSSAPLLHTNALGMYIEDHKAAHRVSVEGRLEMFDDAINKLLWKSKRGLTQSGENGLRNPGDAAWRGSDPGWIYRTDQVTNFKIEPKQIRGVLERTIDHMHGVIKFLGNGLIFSLDHPWIFPLLFALLVGFLTWKYRRWTAYLSILVGVIILFVLYLPGLNFLLPKGAVLLGIIPILAGIVTIAGFKYKTGKRKTKGFFRGALVSRSASIVLWLFCLGLFGLQVIAGQKIDGKSGNLVIGPFPKGTPVSSFMNQDTDASPLKLAAAFRGLFKAFGEIKSNPDITDEEALAAYNNYAMPGLMEISKCLDWELDRGHYFGEYLSAEEKKDLIAFLKTL